MTSLRARYVPDRSSHSEQARSLTVSGTVVPQVSEYAGSRSATPQTSQADSAGSIPVTRSDEKAQVSGHAARYSPQRVHAPTACVPHSPRFATRPPNCSDDAEALLVVQRPKVGEHLGDPRAGGMPRRSRADLAAELRVGVAGLR
jgi:hypothetical protein